MGARRLDAHRQFYVGGLSFVFMKDTTHLVGCFVQGLFVLDVLFSRSTTRMFALHDAAQYRGEASLLGQS